MMNNYITWNIKPNHIKGKKDCTIYYVSRGCINNEEIWLMLNNEALSRNINLVQVNQHIYRALQTHTQEITESV